jgi:hypothetical protein
MGVLDAATPEIWRHCMQQAAQLKVMTRKYGGTGCSYAGNMEALHATSRRKTVNMEALDATYIPKNTQNQSF